MSKTHVSSEHTSRVKQELIRAGVTKYGLLKMEARYLPEMIHPGEHIEAVVYGIKDSYSAMLVATNLRVIFLDRKPLFSITDELTYEMVAGVAHNFRGNRAAVTLHTRVGDYTLKFVNRRSAEKFIAYIEKRRVEHTNGENSPAPAAPTLSGATILAIPTVENALTSPLSEESVAFLHQHQIGVLSTIDRSGNVHGAVIYYFVDANNTLYILTKSDTDKTHNMLAHPQVALTIYDPDHAQTLQLQGMAQIEPDQNVRDFVFRQLSQPRKYADKVDLPPVTKLDKGSFIVLRIMPTTATFHDFSK